MQINAQTRKLLTLFGCILLVIYLLIACICANVSAANERCIGLEGDKVAVDDPRRSGFVTSEELTAEVLPRLGDMSSLRFADIDLDSLQRYLTGLDKIESARVMRLTDGRLRISVVPLVPVARVWQSNGASYYVNRDGKKILASSRYRLDVPQMTAGADFTPSAVMPLLDYLKKDADADKLVTMIAAADTANIILVPAIRGHVINLGDARNIPDKFKRLRRFYSEVMPVKGWHYYDTLSLKWDKQIVATRRHGKLPDLTIPVISELENEGDDLETILAPTASDSTETKKSNQI